MDRMSLYQLKGQAREAYMTSVCVAQAGTCPQQPHCRPLFRAQGVKSEQRVPKNIWGLQKEKYRTETYLHDKLKEKTPRHIIYFSRKVETDDIIYSLS